MKVPRQYRMNSFSVWLLFISIWPCSVWSIVSSECAQAASDQSHTVTQGQLPPIDRVIVVFKTHFDIGYTDLASNVMAGYRTTMIDNTLKVLQDSRKMPSNEQFVWTIPGWPMAKMVDNRQTDERRAQIEQALQQGSLVVHGLPFTLHTESLEFEDLVHGLTYATDTSKKNGLSLPRDAKMSDVPSHSFILPTLLKNSGIDFLHIGCNPASTSVDVPFLFLWQGPDGSQLLTMYSPENYGTTALPPANWPYRTWLALIVSNDNKGPPTLAQVNEVLSEIHQNLPNAKVKVGRLSDFADALQAEHPKLPVIRGDMPDSWIHGIMSHPLDTAIARSVRPMIAMTDTLYSVNSLWGLSGTDPVNSLNSAGEMSLLYGEHTWGGALYWVTDYTPGRISIHYGDEWQQDLAAGKFTRLEQSWGEKSAYMNRAQELVKPVFDDALNTLVTNVNAPAGRIVVYNPLPWPRRDAVHVTLPPATAYYTLQDLATGDVIAATTKDGILSFVTSEIPSLGYKTYHVGPAFTPSMPRVLEDDELVYDANAATIANKYLKLELDPVHGTILAVTNKSSGQRMSTVVDGGGLGQYVYERYDHDQIEAFKAAYLKTKEDWGAAEFGKPNLPSAAEAPYRRSSPSHGTMRFERTATSITAIYSTVAGDDGIAHAIETRISLYKGLSYVGFDLSLLNKPADIWPEGGWIRVPYAVSNPQFRVGRVGAVIDPAKDLVVGSNHAMMAVDSSFSITNQDGLGLVVAPLDSPLVSFDSPGLWRYSKTFIPQRPVAYVNLYNNQWSTNFALWNSGSWHSRLRIALVEPGDSRESTMIVEGRQARYPLMAAHTTAVAGTLPVSKSGPELSCRGVLVSALHHGSANSYTLRLYEQSGKPQRCLVSLPVVNDGLVQKVDLRGTPLSQTESMKAGRFSVDLPAYAPVSLQIELQ